MRGLFITATDTDTGKTFITGCIAATLKRRGLNVGVFKPLASGGVYNENNQLVAEDANFLMMAAGIAENDRHIVNQVCLEPALTPAIAAKISGSSIDMDAVIKKLLVDAERYDIVLVEGVGGIVAPLWEDYLVADMMRRLALPAIVVCNSGLGAINHTVLTLDYALARGIAVKGVIMNNWQGGVLEESNREYIERLGNTGVIGRVTRLESLSRASLAKHAEQCMDMDTILKIIADGSGSE